MSASNLTKEIKKELIRKDIASGNRASQNKNLTLKSRLKLVRMEKVHGNNINLNFR